MTTEIEEIYAFEEDVLTEYTRKYRLPQGGEPEKEAFYAFNNETGNIEYCLRENKNKNKNKHGKTTLQRLWFENGNPAKYRKNNGPVFVLQKDKWCIE